MPVFDRDPGDAIGRDIGPDFDRVAYRRPLPPKDTRVEPQGGGTRLIAIERGRLISSTQLSGAIAYHWYWVESADASSLDGMRAAEARATPTGAVIDRTYEEDAELPFFLADPKFQVGYLLCCGVDVDGNQSRFVWSSYQSNAILDNTVPGDVIHFLGEENGITVNDATISEFVFTAIAPVPIGSFDSLQFAIADYPNPGDLSFMPKQRFAVVAGGPISGRIQLFPGRRVGRGTSVTVTNGLATVTGVDTEFLSQANAGDEIEILGASATILTVNSNTSITLTANWTAPNATIGEWQFIALVRVFALSVSSGGVYRADIENAPYVDVLLDGRLSTPLAPPALTLTPGGNFIRGLFLQVQSDTIKRYNVYRSTGSSDQWTTPANVTLFDRIDHNKNALSAATSRTFEDSTFSAYDRENGQVFRYYVTTTNRDDQDSGRPGEGGAYVSQSSSARLSSGGDNDPTVPSRDNPLNLLFDAFIGGAGVVVGGTANTVDDSDTSQDAFNAYGEASTEANFPGGQAGTTKLKARTRWKWEQNGGATAYPVHINGDEVKLPAPGAPGADIRIHQWIGAWSNATAQYRKVKKGQYVTLSVKVRCDVSALVNGSFFMGVAQYNGGSSQWALRRIRLSDDTFNESSGTYTIGGTLIVSTWQRVFQAFRLDPAYTTDKIVVVFGHQDTNNTNPLYITEPMLADGYELSAWTPNMVNPELYYPQTSNPGDQKGEPRRDPGNRIP